MKFFLLPIIMPSKVEKFKCSMNIYFICNSRDRCIFTAEYIAQKLKQRIRESTNCYIVSVQIKTLNGVTPRI